LEFNIPFQHKYGYIRDETALTSTSKELKIYQCPFGHLSDWQYDTTRRESSSETAGMTNHGVATAGNFQRMEALNSWLDRCKPFVKSADTGFQFR